MHVSDAQQLSGSKVNCARCNLSIKVDNQDGGQQTVSGCKMNQTQIKRISSSMTYRSEISTATAPYLRGMGTHWFH